MPNPPFQKSRTHINLTSVFKITRAFLPELVAQKWGRVINIASTAGKVGFQYTAAYCASKHGVVGFTRARARDGDARGDGERDLPRLREHRYGARAARNIAAKTGGSEEEARKWLSKLSPQNRLMEPEEVAAVAVMLAADASRGINGQAINIDGGAVVY